MIFTIFDIDGTLTNTKNVDDKCFISAFNESFKIDISNENWENFKDVTDWGITEEIIKRELRRKPTSEEFDIMISNFVRNLNTEFVNDSSQFKEVTGAKYFFDSIKSRKDIYTGVATGAWEKSARIKLNAAGINLGGVCFSNSNDHKSRKAIMQDVIDQLKRKLNADPNRIIYFGDGAWDYHTCREMQIEFIGIDIRNDNKLKKMGAKTVFQDFLKRDDILMEMGIPL